MSDYASFARSTARSSQPGPSRNSLGTNSSRIRIGTLIRRFPGGNAGRPRVFAGTLADTPYTGNCVALRGRFGEQCQQAIQVADVAPGAEYPVDLWQQIASPVWMDINPSDTLQYRSAREHDDERHIAPLQLDVIRRGVMLWTNPEDIVLSPFMGIGSEGYVAIEMGRRFVGAELKASYFQQAVANLAAAAVKTQDLFAA